MENILLHTSLENLKGLFPGKLKWKETKHSRTKSLNGHLSTQIDKKKIIIPVEIRKELRTHQLPQLLEIKKQQPENSLLVLADCIY